MRLSRIFVVSLLLSVATSAAAADEQAKAERQLRRITALANDSTARRIVNAEMARYFHVEPLSIVAERVGYGFTYGDAFLFHQLIACESDITLLARELRSGHSIAEIAAAQHVDWRRIDTAAGHFEKLLRDSLYRYFSVAAQTTNASVPYNPVFDWVKADQSGFHEDDLKWAIHLYLSTRYMALRNSGRAGGLSELDFNSFHNRDHLKEDAPRGTPSTTPSISGHH